MTGKPTPPKRGRGGRKKSTRPPSPTILRQRRVAANARERRRMNGLNDAFERLREVSLSAIFSKYMFRKRFFKAQN